jgi:predicted nucleotidyltransferase
MMNISTIQPTPYADLNLVLREFVTRAQNVLADNFIGVYLQGSFATGDFDMHSDVDFLVIIEEDISAADLPALQALHEEMFNLRSPWAQHLEGSYVPKDALRHLPSPPREFLYLDNGSRELVRSNHDDSLVVYWVLRQRGITLVGPEPHTLVSVVSVDALTCPDSSDHG